MPGVVIDQRAVDVPQGSTILDAARKLGINIPTLCFMKGLEPNTSCMMCLVRVKGRRQLVPACATPVQNGMHVENETEEIRDVRRTCMELLLSDHLGDCTAPCQNTCPVHMDIPVMFNQIDGGDLGEAIATIKKDIALPAILGRVCPELCEKGCRRSDVDGPASICMVKRYVADEDLASETPYVPPRAPATGKRVAIVGAGAAGVTAAFHLQQTGHACTVFEAASEVGGKLRMEFDEETLPSSVLEGEVAIVERLGAEFQLGARVESDAALDELQTRFDAVLLATGQVSDAATELLGLPVVDGRLQVDSKTHQTARPGVFAAGDVAQPSKFVVRTVAAGKSAALCIDQYLTSGVATGMPRPFIVRTGRLSSEELVQLTVDTSDAGRHAPSLGKAAGLTGIEAVGESQRCLHCECSQQHNCKLREYAQEYDVRPKRFGTSRRAFERHHQPGGVVYEPGKCILCGLCIQIADKAKEPLGLTFVGRGFDMRVGVPFDRPMSEALRIVARECVEACPTGALAMPLNGRNDAS